MLIELAYLIIRTSELKITDLFTFILIHTNYSGSMTIITAIKYAISNLYTF